ncbi:epimerase [Maritimibacter sp. DP1N21-5]|uniref:epimerase n=1 Tax=Maritimibacter sp. DP1N21-5 TaxID=2836867 RepID=UPI001C437DDB|nr:epimerase [Maritimibacter sp. DP1N21-5]MBV7408835.1 epimerase [Maritimibacter sp. DP1N21-5]
MTKTILILGGTGKFGRHATKAFTEAGWTVRPFDRATEDLTAKMREADAVLMGWNPVGYHLWADHLVPLHDRVARAAAATGARVILPGNVYVYGPGQGMPWTTDTPHRAENPLGRLRRAAEATYARHGAKLTILRCGDFIDTENGGNWFDSHIAATAPKGFIRYPGALDVPHAWAFLPDAARAAVALAEAADRLTDREDVPFPGYTLSGNDLARAMSQALGRPIAVKPFQWLPLRLAQPVVPMLRGVFEMRYLWSLPHALDGGRLAELAPDFTATPLADALRQALAWQERRHAA